MLPEPSAECPAERMRLVAVPVLDEFFDACCQFFSAAELPKSNNPHRSVARPRHSRSEGVSRPGGKGYSGPIEMYKHRGTAGPAATRGQEGDRGNNYSRQEAPPARSEIPPVMVKESVKLLGPVPIKLAETVS